MRNHLVTVAAVSLLLLSACGSDGNDDATAAFTSPADNATVAGAVAVAMTAEGITIEEAGEARADAGHFHVIADAGCTATGDAIAKDADHVHFGKAQTEGVIYLEPGSHELCLQVGDGVHTALDVTDTLDVDVAISTREQWCDVIGQVDVLFEEVDSSSDDFAVKQVGYEQIRRLVAQLEAAIDQTDAAAHDEIQAALAFANDITTALVEAADAAAADAALTPVFESVDEELPGSAWILDNCGVDVNS